jgi:hypothetical protein
MRRHAAYLEQARVFERLAADEIQPDLRAQFARQAATYREIAERREKFVRAVFQIDSSKAVPISSPIMGVGRGSRHGEQSKEIRALITVARRSGSD